MITRNDSLFALFVETALPRDCLVVALRHVYFDESGTDDGSAVMAMAGYVFEANQAARFSRDWLKVLKEYNLPYAHMADSVSQNGVYSHLTDQQCDKINRLLIENIKRRTLFGFSVTLNPRHYYDTIGREPDLPSAYSFCVLSVVHLLAHWADRKGDNGKFAFFFEAGHQNQEEANFIMNGITSGGAEKIAEYHYLSHTFFTKTESPPLHAADMLAWHVTKFSKDRIKGKTNPRADFKALIRHSDFTQDYSESTLEEYRGQLAELIRVGAQTQP